MKIKVSLDEYRYQEKPEGLAGAISKRIAQNPMVMELSELADLVGNHGCSFAPAIFSKGRRKAENFEETQMFGLDFDSGISISEVRMRAEMYGLPIAFLYHTFHSTEEEPRFRAIFLNDVPIEDKRVAEIMIAMLLEVFPQADKSCKDVSRMFYGGKGLDGEVCEDTINIVKLTESFQRVTFEKGGGHYKRGVSQFAKRYNIACSNNCLQIYCVHESGTVEEIGEKIESHPYIYGSKTVFPPNFPKYILYSGYQPDVRKSYREESPVRISWGQGGIEKKCRLYYEFMQGYEMHHDLKFLLLTNLTHIEGGVKRFHSIIRKWQKADENKWRFYATYAKDRGYKPQSCDRNCPHVDICRHKTNLVLTVKEPDKIIRLSLEEDYQPVEVIYRHIEQCLEESLRDHSLRIFLIPAQTAIGKTEAYCNLIRDHPDQYFIVAVPTNQLKREVSGRLERRGVKVMVTPSLDEMGFPEDLKGEIEYYYRWGLGKNVRELLQDYIRENKESSEPEIVNAVYQCRNYLNSLKRLKKHRVLITTHARLLTFSREMMEPYWVIIDEDILSTLFKNMYEVSVHTVKRALSSGHCPALLERRLEAVLSVPDGQYRKIEEEVCYQGLEREALEELGIKDNVNGLAVASTCYRRGNRIHYFSPQVLPKGRYLVLSATASAELYRNYFEGRTIVEYPCYKARYKGELKQLTAYSMSRQCIQDHLKELKQYLEQFRETHQLITFAKYEEELNGTGLHFGNAEGIDSLNGKNLIVLGTPHMEEFVYKLVGCHLEMAVNGEELAVRRVRKYGYEFNLMTYKKERLRNLQIYLLKKELEQCIGRARLLRNRCEVLVLSNFPCEQAEIIQEDYLGDDGSCSPVMAGEG